LARRLRQHNGELSGGARSTRKNAEHWKYLAIVTSEQFDKKSAMSCEWHIRYPTGVKPRPREFGGPVGRLSGLKKVLDLPKFKEYSWQIWIENIYISYVVDNETNPQNDTQGACQRKKLVTYEEIIGQTKLLSSPLFENKCDG
jgi:hypothetical protein